MDWQAIHILDQQCTLALNGIYSGFTDPIMRFFSNIPIWVPMYIIVAAALFLRLGWKKALIVIASIALTFLCCDQLSNLVKVSVARLRPCHDPYMIENGVRLLEKAGGAYGFFSGHAANFVRICSIVIYGIPQRQKTEIQRILILDILLVHDGQHQQGICRQALYRGCHQRSLHRRSSRFSVLVGRTVSDFKNEGSLLRSLHQPTMKNILYILFRRKSLDDFI